MEFATEHLGTQIAVVFDLTVATVTRHELLTRVGNPVLVSNDSTGVYVIAVPDGTDDHWVRTYRRIAGVAAADVVRIDSAQRGVR